MLVQEHLLFQEISEVQCLPVRSSCPETHLCNVYNELLFLNKPQISRCSLLLTHWIITMLCTATLRSDSPDSNGHRSELLEESEHQVPEGGPQWLVVVTHDVRCVLFQLDECVLGLQMQDVTVRRLLHLHLRDSILTTNKNKAQ